MAAVENKMACPVLRIEYDLVGHVGSAYFVEGHCCDMMGCIGFFRSIDAKVRFIRTFSGNLPDTCYVKEGRDWAALPARYPGYGFGVKLDGAVDEAIKGCNDSVTTAKKKTSNKFDEPPTEKQLGFLTFLGHAGPMPATKGEAGFLINELKKTV